MIHDQLEDLRPEQARRSAAGAGRPVHGVQAVPVALALDSEVQVRVIMMVRVRQPRSLRGLRVSGSQCRLELSQEREAAGCGPLHFHSERLHFKSDRLHFAFQVRTTAFSF